ncbi:hypothetical protein H6F96_21860 [Microcoleus sp. FACHB-53]|nr:hypothetical protein [Microcoleus sp. FACHB-53]
MAISEFFRVRSVFTKLYNFPYQTSIKYDFSFALSQLHPIASRNHAQCGKFYEGVDLDLASCWLYSRVTFQAIALPCPLGRERCAAAVRQIAHYWMEQLPVTCVIA